MALEIRPLTGAIGAEIIGADVRDPAQFDAIFQAFTDHSVIAIRDQNITPDDQIAFAERIGPININRFFKKDFLFICKFNKIINFLRCRIFQ